MKKDVITLNFKLVIEVDENDNDFVTLKEALKGGFARTIDSELTVSTINEGDISESEIGYIQATEAILYGLMEEV